MGRPLLPALAAILLATIVCAPTQAQCEMATLSVEEEDPDELFAYCVTVRGDIALIGMPGDEHGGQGIGGKGSAFVFQRCGGGWSRVSKLTASDGEVGDVFGSSVALTRGLGVIGAISDNTDEPNTGSAYIFECCAGVWAEAAKLIAEDGAEGDHLGASVAISGDMAVVGAPDDDAMGFRSGSAYVFERQLDATWTQFQKLTASDGAPVDHFGDAVAISGAIIVVGAWDDDDQGWGSGSAYVFERALNGLWYQVAKLRASNGKFLDAFGSCVGVDGNTALIGSPGAHGLGYWEGAAYVFERASDGTWSEVAKLFAADGENSDGFGCAVALEADVAVIGARGDDDHGQASGSAYVFVRAEDGTWSEVAKLVRDDGEPWDSFGRAVAVSRNIAVIGTYPQDPNEPPKPAMAYIYAVGPDEDGDGVMDACECPGDLNHDWIVGHSDLGMFLASWQLDDGGDCDGDGDTDHADLGILLANWGNICP